MAYAAFSVVYGEQPSAAKWNILGTNDASFNDGTGIGNNVIKSAQLKAAQTDSTPGSITDVGTGYSTGATLSLTAGTYLLIARAVYSMSVAQSTTMTGEIYNSTDASILDTAASQQDYVSGTVNANIPLVNIVISTLASSKTVIARYKVNDAAGISAVSSCKLIAIPVGV